MSERDDRLQMTIELGKLALAFGRVNRATFHEDGKTPESDPTHVVMLGLVACSLAPVHLDQGAIAEYVLVHDIVEAKVGDTDTSFITAEARRAKSFREAEAMRELFEQFADNEWLTRRLMEYEDQEVPEARYVRFLDKAMPKVTHYLNGCASIKASGRSHEELVQSHRDQAARLIEQYPEFKNTPTLDLLLDVKRLSEDAYSE